ncbi:MAG TPA: energy-coupling factor transporter transmembrane component T [Candidatus Limnocylindria bacterium]|nr:energy-coupling factor transporter transmembrane component T [Candidatus Limnocylindria bacterium]
MSAPWGRSTPEHAGGAAAHGRATPDTVCGPYHRLNPLTKATLAVAVTLASLALGGLLVPALLFGFVVVPGAIVARVVARMLRLAVVATLPVAIAVVLVQGLAGLGVEGAVAVSLRVFVMAAALALFGLTTPARELVADLERRGVSPRIAFAAASTIGALPALAAQAQVVRDAQRARGLDIEGSVMARIRGIVPLVGPMVAGTIHSIELRSLALEARAFGRPGRRDLLWAPSDAGWERALRWIAIALLLAIVAAKATGAVGRLP